LLGLGRPTLHASGAAGIGAAGIAAAGIGAAGIGAAGIGAAGIGAAGIGAAGIGESTKKWRRFRAAKFREETSKKADSAAGAALLRCTT
jgi:hypothetical protein